MVMKCMLLIAALLFISQVQCGYKYVCHKCIKDNDVKGFDDEDEFVKHSEWHIQQDEEKKIQLMNEAKQQQEQDDLRPKLFHCHHCQFVESFNSSTEFIAHIDEKHKATTAEECTLFIPQGKLKLKSHKDMPPELNNLNAAFDPNAGGGGFARGGGGGYGGMGGGGGDYDER